MKKIMGFLFVITLLPAAFMVGCNNNAPSSPAAPTMTFTSTFTGTATRTPTATRTSTNSPTITMTRTSTFTPTVTNSPTITNTLTETSTITATPTVTATAQPAQAIVPLGTSGTYAVLAGSAITDAGEDICGSYGIAPGTTETGAVYTFNALCPGSVAAFGSPGPAQTAQDDLGIAYTNATALARGTPVPVPTVGVGDIGGETLYPGLYSAVSIGVTGSVTLDGQSAATPVFIFQISSTFITGTSSQIVLKNGATAANVYWAVGSSATLGTNSVNKGIIMAYSAITLNTGATLEGRALAQTAAVVFDGTNIITKP